MTEWNKGSQTHFSHMLLKQSHLQIQKLHSCYFLKRLAMSHSRSAKLKGYLVTSVRKGHFEEKKRWKHSYAIHIQMAVHWQWPWSTEPAAGQRNANKIIGSLLSITTCAMLNHLEEGRNVESFISHSSGWPCIGNKRNKSKRQTMNQMWFYQKPAQFHCPLWVLLMTHCLTLGDFFETVHTDTVAKSNITLWKRQFKELWLLCPALKMHKASCISLHFITIWQPPEWLPSVNIHRTMKRVTCPHFSKYSRFRVQNLLDQAYYFLPALSHYLSCIISASNKQSSLLPLQCSHN